MSFFDGLNDGDRAEIGWGPAGDTEAFGVIRHQHLEHQAVQRQVARHGAGYQPMHAQSSGGASALAAAQPPAADTQGGDGYARCELLMPAAAAPVRAKGNKEAEPSRRLREAMGLCRKRRQSAGPLGIGESREVRGGKDCPSHAPPAPCMPPAAAALGGYRD
jgi:hypothetical protein